MANTLNFKDLAGAVSGTAAGFRLIQKLEPMSPKVFPPTYEGGTYATETRRINGQEVPCVLLDSVPSQANRMELALQDAWDGGEIELPMVVAGSLILAGTIACEMDPILSGNPTSQPQNASPPQEASPGKPALAAIGESALNGSCGFTKSELE